MESLDILANNLANVSTTGFKLDREAFNVYSATEGEGLGPLSASKSPITDRVWTNFSQGSLTQTGNSLDVGLEGDGFIAVSAGDRLLYTRNGQLKIGLDGSLQTAEGYRLQTTAGKPLVEDIALPLEIDRAGGVSQAGQEIGRIYLANLDGAAGVEKLGSTYFKVADGISLRPSDAGVRQGYLEASNVNPADSSVRLVGVMRQFEMLQRAMQLGAEMNRKSIDEVAKTS